MMRLAILAGALALAACQPAAQTPAAPAEPAAAETPAAPATIAEPAKPSGPPTQIEAATGDDSLMAAAHVTDVRNIKDVDYKIFSTAGGDPAVNGLYTYLAHYNEEDRGWTQIWMIGDFNSWDVVEESATRVVLQISRSWADQASGDIKTVDEKLIIDLPAAADGKLTVTPAT
jgi:hypothetical protein